MKDCQFLVHDIYQPSSVPVLISAHSFVLGAASPIFQTMLFGSLPPPKGTTEVKNTTPRAFQSMIDFIYHGARPGGSVPHILEVG